MNPLNFTDFVDFYKMQGSGNDFVLLDNRTLKIGREAMPEWAIKACARAFGVCADGIIFLNEAQAGSGLDYRWDFYNNDGSRAEMCGNGARCAAALAHALGLAGPVHVLGTDAGPIRAEVFPDESRVKVQLTKASAPELNIPVQVQGQALTAHFVNTGVPHTVFVLDGVADVDLPLLGRATRFHERFAPAGTNVNFIQVLDREHILLRTYERGVEAETFACGTGAAASAIVAHALGLTGPRVTLTPTGKEDLEVFLEDGETFLKGPAKITFTGRLNLPVLGIKI